jgi:hypothetical protein
VSLSIPLPLRFLDPFRSRILNLKQSCEAKHLLISDHSEKEMYQTCLHIRTSLKISFKTLNMPNWLHEYNEFDENVALILAS